MKALQAHWTHISYSKVPDFLTIAVGSGRMHSQGSRRAKGLRAQVTLPDFTGLFLGRRVWKCGSIQCQALGKMLMP